MPSQIIMRPDGLWAVFSTVVDGFLLDEATEDEVVRFFVEEAMRDTERNVRNRIEQAKTRSRPNEAMIPTYEEAARENARNFPASVPSDGARDA